MLSIWEVKPDGKRISRTVSCNAICTRAAITCNVTRASPFSSLALFNSDVQCYSRLFRKFLQYPIARHSMLRTIWSESRKSRLKRPRSSRPRRSRRTLRPRRPRRLRRTATVTNGGTSLITMWNLFFGLLYWVMGAQPVKCSKEALDHAPWSNLTSNVETRAHFIRGIAHNLSNTTTHSFYIPCFAASLPFL